MASARVVHVFSRVSGITGLIQKRRPDINLISIAVDEHGKWSKSDADFEKLKNAEVLITDPDLLSPVLYDLPKAKWVQITWAGVDAMFKTIDRQRPSPPWTLTRLSGQFGPYMAEYTIGHVIAWERQFFATLEDQRQKYWNRSRKYRGLPSLTMGILGAGNIGCDVAKACKALGMKVIGMVRREIPREQRSQHIDEYLLNNQLSEVLERSDYVCNVLPSTADTRDMLSGDTLRYCRQKKPLFINVGRGDVITEYSLINALREGWISGAVLDVFQTEPLPADSALWETKNVFISPHNSALSFDFQVADVFCNNYDKYIAGEPLDFAVNWAEGY